MEDDPFKLDPRLVGKHEQASSLPFLVGAGLLMLIGFVTVLLYILFVMNGGW